METKLPMRLVDRASYLIERSAGKRVLHLGCTNYPYAPQALDDGSLLHLRLSQVTSALVGIDSDAQGLAQLNSLGFGELYEGNLERLDAVEINDTFDVIIAGEIIEHLSNPGLFLRGVRRFMSPETELIITTVNAFCAMRFIQYLLRGRGGRSEPVHPDHVAYYSYRTLTLSVERAGFRPEEFCFYDIGPEHRKYLPFYYKSVNDVVVAVTRHLSDGVILRCRLAEPTGDDCENR